MAEEKPAILQEARFTVHEGWAYRAFRGGAILLNKLFFSCLVLLLVWLVVATLQGTSACSVAPRVAANGTADEGTARSCNAFLTPTATFLGGMAIASFLLSLLCGLLGLVVGKQVLAAAPAELEVGAGPKQPPPPAP